MKNYMIFVLLIISVVIFCAGAEECIDPRMEINTDRMGMDYKNFELKNPNPCECRDVCYNDSECLAYTYVKPGVQSRNARCWLKNDVPDPVTDKNCISGLKYTVEDVEPGCNSTLVDPVLSYVKSDNYIGSDGNKYTGYYLSVTNYQDYSTDLFVASPDLPPCGKNINSSRTWVSIYTNSGDYLYGFCALNNPLELQNLWFSVPYGTTAPPFVFVVLQDRLCNQKSRASVTIPVTYGLNLIDSASDFIPELSAENSRLDTSSTLVDPSEFFGVHPVPIP
ncbi:MAG: hypothetical protein GXY48_05440 [Methanomicrobiales archaeon]|nr:hypothetical protein [Methanomicrobiales archaeon]